MKWSGMGIDAQRKYMHICKEVTLIDTLAIHKV